MDNGHDPALRTLQPEAEGECVMTLCRRIGGELHYEQHRFSAQEMRSALIYTEMKIELSSMLARSERAMRDASRAEPEPRYDPEKEPRFQRPDHD